VAVGHPVFLSAKYLAINKKKLLCATKLSIRSDLAFHSSKQLSLGLQSDKVIGNVYTLACPRTNRLRLKKKGIHISVIVMCGRCKYMM